MSLLKMRATTSGFALGACTICEKPVPGSETTTTLKDTLVTLVADPGVLSGVMTFAYSPMVLPHCGVRRRVSVWGAETGMETGMTHAMDEEERDGVGRRGFLVNKVDPGEKSKWRLA